MRPDHLTPLPVRPRSSEERRRGEERAVVTPKTPFIENQYLQRRYMNVTAVSADSSRKYSGHLPQDRVGEESQCTHVAAFHAATLNPALRIGEKEDLYIHDGKIAVLGLDDGKGSASYTAEFDVDATHAADTLPADVASNALQPLAQVVTRGINGVLLVMGTTSSGKTDLVHGQPEAKGEWNGLMEAALAALFAALPSDNLSHAENCYQARARECVCVHLHLLGDGGCDASSLLHVAVLCVCCTGVRAFSFDSRRARPGLASA